MDIEEVKDEDIWELCQMTSDCFSEKAIPPKKEKFYRHYQNSKCKHFVIKNEGKIVSSITIFEVNIIVRHKVLVVGGIGDVVTEKSNRCKHYSSQLLEYCLNYMKEQHYDLTMLHASLVKYQKHYEKFGYDHMRTFNYNLTFESLENLKKEVKSDLTGKYEEIGISENKDQLMKMHLSNRKVYSLTIDYEKSDNYFDKWVKSELTELNEKKESKIFSYMEDDKVKGSIAMSINKETDSNIEMMVKFLLLDNESCKDVKELRKILFGLLYEKSLKLGIITENKKKTVYKIPKKICLMCGIDKKDENYENNFKIEEEFDDCWMYKILNEKMNEDDIEIIKGDIGNVIFRIDNF